MRELTTLASAKDAQTFAEYLRTLNIETRVEQSPRGTVLWVCDEDQVTRARAEWESFQKEPQAERYRKAARLAGTRRAESPSPLEAEQPGEPAFRPFPAGSYRITMILAFLSVFLTVMMESPDGMKTAQQFFIAREVVYQGRVVLRPSLPEVRQGEVWRLITPIFLHFGIFHLLVNMVALRWLGGQVEQVSGSLRYLLLVLLLAVTSNLGQYWFPEIRFNHGIPLVTLSSPFGGMSGVLFGLFGYIWMKCRYEPSTELYIHPNTVILMLGWFLICLAGWAGSVANTAHGVGLIVGMIGGYVSAWWNGWGEEIED